MSEGYCVQFGADSQLLAVLISLATRWNAQSRFASEGYCIQIGTGAEATAKAAALDNIVATCGSPSTSTCADWSTGCC